jgi:alkylhydroperoxidase family enzyme
MRALIVVRLSRVTDATTSPERQDFDVPQMVELTHIVALENLRARFNLALDIGSAGFSEGMVCARPG